MIQTNLVGVQRHTPLHTSHCALSALILLLLLVSGCGATAVQIVPTARPTATADIDRRADAHARAQRDADGDADVAADDRDGRTIADAAVRRGVDGGGGCADR